MKSPDWRTTMRVAWNDTSRAALISLLVTNAIPLVGVLTGRWSLFSVMLLYWMENGVVGAYNAVKIVMAQGGSSAGSTGLFGRLPLAVFFWFHYGIFWFVHGVFVVVLFGGTATGRGIFGAGLGGLGPFNALTLARADAELPGGLWGTVGLLAVSHGISFVNNFVGRGEYQRVTPHEQMMQPPVPVRAHDDQIGRHTFGFGQDFFDRISLHQKCGHVQRLGFQRVLQILQVFVFGG